MCAQYVMGVKMMNVIRKERANYQRKKLRRETKKKHCRRIQKKKVTVRIRTSEKRREGWKRDIWTGTETSEEEENEKNDM